MCQRLLLIITLIILIDGENERVQRWCVCQLKVDSP